MRLDDFPVTETVLGGETIAEPAGVAEKRQQMRAEAALDFQVVGRALVADPIRAGAVVTIVGAAARGTRDAAVADQMGQFVRDPALKRADRGAPEAVVHQDRVAPGLQIVAEERVFRERVERDRNPQAVQFGERRAEAAENAVEPGHADPWYVSMGKCRQ